jgi:signal transduction histidine kinase
MSPRKKARVAFASAVVLLLVCGTAATITIVRLLESAQWIAHTYEVQVALGQLQSELSDAARLRASFLNSGDTSVLGAYDASKSAVHSTLTKVRDLTRDNPRQRGYSNQLGDLALRRIELLDSSIDMRRSGPLDEATQLRIGRLNITVAQDFADIVQKMMVEEQSLLVQRREVSGNLFTVTLGILLAAFALAILLFWIHFNLLNRELDQREAMEQYARRVSGRILQVQDEERRKFSRELHDSLGQLLSMAKMHMYALVEKNPEDQLLRDINQLLDQSISETRTISHLLHPPLLDEMGLPAAVRWFAEGFAKRSGIKVDVEIAEDVERASRPADLALFRVLQESLTNIHRHSKSARAEVSLRSLPGAVMLRVRDYGKGMPHETIQHFLKTGGRVGVGLSGMRERIREQHGQFAIQSDETGTTVSVIMPIAVETDANPLAATASAD